MNFEFDNVVPLVHEKKKYTNFTVTEIGGPEEIIKWRQMQEAKESLLRLKLGARDTRLTDYEALIGQKLDTPKISSMTWAEKAAFASSERERLAKLEANVIKYPPWVPEEKPKPTFFQRIKGFFKSLWTESNF